MQRLRRVKALYKNHVVLRHVAPTVVNPNLRNCSQSLKKQNPPQPVLIWQKNQLKLYTPVSLPTVIKRYWMLKYMFEVCGSVSSARTLILHKSVLQKKHKTLCYINLWTPLYPTSKISLPRFLWEIVCTLTHGSNFLKIQEFLIWKKVQKLYVTHCCLAMKNLPMSPPLFSK